MRKFENVDIVSALGAVVELNTEHYKGDFKYDIEMFKNAAQAAQNPNSENSHFLWLSRHSGTYCFNERDVYVKDTAAHNYWMGSADILGTQTSNPTIIVNDRIQAYAVKITGIENGRIKGDLYQLDYRGHVRHLNKTALPKHTVTVKFEDGTKLTLPHAEYEGKRNSLYYQHGKVIYLKSNPEDRGALRDILKQAREQRDKNATPATFKVRVHAQKPEKQSKPDKPLKQEQPSIKQQIAEGKKQLSEKKPAPTRAAVKNKTTGLGD